MEYNISRWPFFETPWDILIGCEGIHTGNRYTSQQFCHLSIIAGVLSAYVLPFITLFSVIANISTSISLWIIFLSYAYCQNSSNDEYYEDIIEETRLKVAVVTKGKNNSPVSLIRKLFKRYYKEKAADEDDYIEEVEETTKIIFGKIDKKNISILKDF
ncbi:unnamed protein product [Schistosoma rodhaini]|nr:unnamed protein product [Schistosoma rodhaini]